MTREEAARILDPDGFNDVLPINTETSLEAMEMGAAALRETAWVKTSERLPTEDDGFVVVMTNGIFTECVPVAAWYSTAGDKPEAYPYWMPIPPLPEVEG